MKLSKRTEYGIKAAVRLSQPKGPGYTQSREIAEAEGLPAKFLESILLALRSAGILESKVGAGGGYRLAKPASTIRVSDLITALDRTDPESVDGTLRMNGYRPGQAAIEVLNERLTASISDSIGSLSLSDLCALAEEHATGLAGVG